MLAKLTALCRTEDIVCKGKSDCVRTEAWGGWAGVIVEFRTPPLRIPATVEPLEFWWSSLWRVSSSFVTNSDYPRGKQ